MAQDWSTDSHRNSDTSNSSHYSPCPGINIGFNTTVGALVGREPAYVFSNLPMILYYSWRIKILMNSPRPKISFRYYRRLTDIFMALGQLCLLHINDLWKLYLNYC